VNTRRETLEQLREEMDATNKAIAMHRELLAIAQRYERHEHDTWTGFGPETERQQRAIEEWEDELYSVIERAAAAGLMPEDIRLTPPPEHTTGTTCGRTSPSGY
jgi:hypothetical protein